MGVVRATLSMMTEAEDEEDWVEIRRFTDRMGAEMIRDFLADHDVRVAIHGNPQATRMTWSQTSDVIRIVVARADLEMAKEALEAMTAGEQHPFRGPTPPPEADEEEERVENFEKSRSGLSAAVLALFIPIGAGHFYARHGAAGTILCVGMLGSFLAAAIAGERWFFSAWGILVVLDIIGSFFAVKRFNERRIPPDGVQRRWAAIAVAIAFIAAWALAR